MTQPFKPGDKVVDLTSPHHGSLTVETITLTGPPPGHWRLTVHGTGPRSGCWTNAPASNFIKTPPRWREPPFPPTTNFHSLLSQVHGPITEAEIRDADLLDDTPASRHNHAIIFLDMARWWLEVWTQVNKPEADEQACRLIDLAISLVEQDSHWNQNDHFGTP